MSYKNIKQVGWSKISYKTIKNRSFGEFIERKSRFIGYICPVKTEEDALEFIKEIKKKHYDATHNVYAYILRDQNIIRSSDDGEPQGTAGVPVLEVMQREEIFDVAVVVTRYFGGILLGAGGLIRAYSKGAKTAIDSAEIVTMTECYIIKIDMEYNYYSIILNLLDKFDFETVSSDFSDIVSIVIRIPIDQSDLLMQKIREITSAKVVPEICKQEFAPIKFK